MAGRLAIDFGTSNTVVAVWDEARQEGVPLFLPEFGRLTATGEVAGIPSVVHYGGDRRRWIGAQVHKHNVYESARTFRWMKRYIGRRSPRFTRIDDRDVTNFDAGRDFLADVMMVALEEAGATGEEVALTVPVESYEHYATWLGEVARQAGILRYRLIDEASAAALGYGAHIQPGDVYLVFDFGGGTLDVAVVLIEDEAGAIAGRRCRVLGKAGLELGGATIDQWLFQEVLKRGKREETDEDVRRLGRALLVECERAKERLSTHERAEVMVTHPETGAVIAETFTRTAFESVLDRNDFFQQLDRTMRKALNAARERGYDEERIKAVLMVGGGSLIPAVQTTLQRMFGRERVHLDRPLDAVARGAAAFVAGVDFYDHIQHDYAIRHTREGGGYEYRVLVKRGTPYPSADTVARLTVRATFDGQDQLALAIFELGEAGADKGGVELIFTPSGEARLAKLAPDEALKRVQFWMNEDQPTFLKASPPAMKGEARFEVQFRVDGNKRLTVTARDLVTGTYAYEDYPVVALV